MKILHCIVGILALQGSVIEHRKMLETCGASVREVRIPTDLDDLSGIILPGGESTAIGKLLVKQALYEPLRQLILDGLPVWGTCAGAILLAKEGSPWSLKVGNFSVQRNGFGSQLHSEVRPVEIEGIAKDYPAVFIRAPRFVKYGEGVEVLSSISVPLERGIKGVSEENQKYPPVSPSFSKEGELPPFTEREGRGGISPGKGFLEPIFLQQGNLWASSFHPELTEDVAVHRAFVERCRKVEKV